MKKLLCFALALLVTTPVFAVKEYAKRYPTDTALEVYTPNNPPPPSGGTPGGSSGELQYNNSGNFGGVTNSIVSGSDITIMGTIVADEADVTKSPVAPGSSSINFNADPGGLFANGTVYNYYIYSYYYDGSNYAYDSIGSYVSSSDPNDSNLYNIDLSWSSGTDANGYIIYDSNTGYYLDVGDVTSAQINGSTGWNTGGLPTLSPSSIIIPGKPIWINNTEDWGTTDFNALTMGLSGSNHLRLRWKYNGGFGSGALRFESDDSTIRTINANVYAEMITATNSISGYVYPSTMAQNYIGYGSSGGYITGASNFTWNPSSTRLLVSNSGITAQSQLHLNYSTATATYMQVTNSSTGTASSDGFQVGISTTGIGEIRQKENLGVNFYTNNILRGGWDSSGNLNIAGLTASRAVATDSSKNLVSSATTDTELGYLSGVTSAIQTQITNKSKRWIVLPVEAAKLPTSNPARIDASEQNWRLLFDASTSQSAQWQFVVPQDYGSALTARLLFTMNSTQVGTLAVIWRTYVMKDTEGDAEDVNSSGYASANSGTETLANNQTAGYVRSLTITQTNADSVAAGDFVQFKIDRDASNISDTGTGDAELVGILLEYTSS